eukprot:GEZU01020367.1.p1 GENE.GEZU01020367.1~~GEZU01020367.1.p1  ORF type:complete len:508 (-),score=84.08 GEZU01020367.1:93-1616(-)
MMGFRLPRALSAATTTRRCLRSVVAKAPDMTAAGVRQLSSMPRAKSIFPSALSSPNHSQESLFVTTNNVPQRSFRTKMVNLLLYCRITFLREIDRNQHIVPTTKNEHWNLHIKRYFSSPTSTPTSTTLTSASAAAATAADTYTSASVQPMTPQTKELADHLLKGERFALAKSISLVESSLYKHQVQAQHLITYVLNSTALPQPEGSNEPVQHQALCLTEQQKKFHEGFKTKTFRIGISGPPGAGKSTFIEAFGSYLTSLGHKVGVLAVDPSSSRSGGSILGDKTRMHELSRDPNAFVRPSPSRGHLGGVTAETYEIMILCETAGYDIIIIETVGVGQSETQVADLVDLVLLLVPPAGGDELQGIKKGIVELADLIVVNKSDGNLLPAATVTKSEYKHALQLLRPKSRHWSPKVLSCSSVLKQNIDTIWLEMGEFRKTMEKCGELVAQRENQRKRWMWKQIHDELLYRLHKDPVISQKIAELQNQVTAGTLSPRTAADQVMSTFLARK